MSAVTSLLSRGLQPYTFLIELSLTTYPLTHPYRHHYNELPADLRTRLHLDLPVGFMAYFESRYPCLLMRCVEIACRFLSAEKTFAPFCRVIAPLFQQNRPPTAAVVAAVVAPMEDQSIKSTTEQQTLPPPLDAVTTLAAVTLSTKSSIAADKPALPPSSLSEPAAAAVVAQETHTFPFPSAIDSAATTDLPSGDGHIAANTADKEQVQQAQLQQQQVTVSEDVVVWQGSALAQSLGSRGWWRMDLSNPNDHWVDAGCSAAVSIKPRTQHQHLIRASTDFKYRSRLCTHWELTGGSGCPMRKKGKCDFGESLFLHVFDSYHHLPTTMHILSAFISLTRPILLCTKLAHGPLELRVKETRRGKWAKGQQLDSSSGEESSFAHRLSGGEDVLGAARSIERVRAAEGSVSSFERSYGGGSGTNQQRPNKTYPSPLHQQQPMMNTHYANTVYPPPAAVYQQQQQTRKPQPNR